MCWENARAEPSRDQMIDDKVVRPNTLQQKPRAGMLKLKSCRKNAIKVAPSTTTTRTTGIS